MAPCSAKSDKAIARDQAQCSRDVLKLSLWDAADLPRQMLQSSPPSPAPSAPASTPSPSSPGSPPAT